MRVAYVVCAVVTRPLLLRYYRCLVGWCVTVCPHLTLTLLPRCIRSVGWWLLLFTVDSRLRVRVYPYPTLPTHGTHIYTLHTRLFLLIAAPTRAITPPVRDCRTFYLVVIQPPRRTFVVACPRLLYFGAIDCCWWTTLYTHRPPHTHDYIPPVPGVDGALPHSAATPTFASPPPHALRSTPLFPTCPATGLLPNDIRCVGLQPRLNGSHLPVVTPPVPVA